jgi:hypothetical protein
LIEKGHVFTAYAYIVTTHNGAFEWRQMLLSVSLSLSLSMWSLDIEFRAEEMSASGMVIPLADTIGLPVVCTTKVVAV